jgi:hypothetical protein
VDKSAIFFKIFPEQVLVGYPKQSTDEKNDDSNEHDVPEEPLAGISTKRVSPQIPKPKEEFSIE